MNRFALVLVPLTFALSGTVAHATAPDPNETDRAGDVSRHRVDLKWKPDSQDIISGPVIVDTFDSFGPPFGENRPVETHTPRNQIGTDERSGKWTVFLTRGDNPGKCFGTFEVDRDVIETTPTSQTVDFDGTASLRGCSGARKFRNAVPGRIGKLNGRSFCTARGCNGALKVRGHIRY